MKNITFDNKEQKLKVYSQAVSTKTAREYGTKHANQLKPYDMKYRDNEYYKVIYIKITRYNKSRHNENQRRN